MSVLPAFDTLKVGHIVEVLGRELNGILVTEVSRLAKVLHVLDDGTINVQFLDRDGQTLWVRRECWR